MNVLLKKLLHFPAKVTIAQIAVEKKLTITLPEVASSTLNLAKAKTTNYLTDNQNKVICSYWSPILNGKNIAGSKVITLNCIFVLVLICSFKIKNFKGATKHVLYFWTASSDEFFIWPELDNFTVIPDLKHF